AGLATIDTGIADLMKGREGGGGKIKRPEDPKFDPKKDTVATTEQPYMPKELKPAGEEPPPTLGGKILWAAGKILDFIDSWPRLGKWMKRAMTFLSDRLFMNRCTFLLGAGSSIWC